MNLCKQAQGHPLSLVLEHVDEDTSSQIRVHYVTFTRYDQFLKYMQTFSLVPLRSIRILQGSAQP